MAEKMTRRTFLKGAAAATIAVSLSGVLAGCGENGLADNEVQIGSYTVSVSNLDVAMEGTESAGMTYAIVGTVKIRFQKDGNSLEGTSYDGVFRAKVGEESLKTVSPSGYLLASDILWGAMSTKEKALRMEFATKGACEAYQNGTPAVLTITLNSQQATLFLLKKNGKYIATKTLPTA